MLPLVVGAVGSFVWSFVLAAIALQAKHWRNGRLLKNGGLPYKDCVFAWPVVWLTTVLGVVACAVVWLVHGSTTAMIFAAIGAPASLGILPTLGAIARSRSRDGGASRD